MTDFLTQERILELLSTYGLRIVGALLIFFIGRKVALWLSKMFVKIVGKTSLDETTASFLSSAIYMILLLIVVLAALSNLGVETTSFVALLGAMGLAIGMALRDSFSSIGAGLLLVFFKPFKVKDLIDLSGVLGTVEAINIFSTVLKTTDNKQIIIPNSKVVTDNIINYSAKKLRRVDLVFGIGYEDDLLKAKKVLGDIISSYAKILKEPEPLIAVLALSQSSVDFTVRVWVKTDDYWDVYFYLNENVKLRFDEEKISIPYPQLTVSKKP
ncbi:MAG: mechanosensitive ion channel [Campylobacteraceae bacterium]|jgi:small conductance mechanosensitive channel|nr:mechanosensitive ion channel [Campylobacteraceae bacterium]